MNYIICLYQKMYNNFQLFEVCKNALKAVLKIDLKNI